MAKHVAFVSSSSGVSRFVFMTVFSLGFMFALLAVPSLAIWDDTTGVIWVNQGELVSLGEHSVRVIDASVDEGVPFIEIKRRANSLYKGFIETGKPVEIKNEIFVEYMGSSARFHYGPQVKLRVSQWVDGKILNARFPRYMNRESFYNTWLDVENTGTKDALFRTELTQAGQYNAASGMYLAPDGKIVPILLDLQFPVQDVRIPYGVTERVAYNYVAPNRKQNSLLGNPDVRAGNAVEKQGDVVFRLFFKNQLLDELTIPDVRYGPSPSGYIDDMDLPDILINNEPYESKVTVTNAGPGGNNIDSNKLNLELTTKGFTIGLSSDKLTKTSDLQVSDNLLRKGMLTGEKNDWRFTITPHVPAGEYDLEFRLWQNRHDYLYSTYDVFTKRVTVIENFNKLIKKFEVPPSAVAGSQIHARVTLSNVGMGQLLNVNVRAPSLLDGPVKRVLTIPSGSEMVLDYFIPAMVSGPAPVTVEVYPHQASNDKWNDPYSESGYALDTATKTVNVVGEEDGPSLPPLPPELMPVQPSKASAISGSSVAIGKPVAASQVVVSEDETVPPESTTGGVIEPISVSQEEAPVAQATFTKPVIPQVTKPVAISPAQPAMVALAVILLIVVLLAIRVVYNHYSRQRKFESHVAVSEHIKRKK